MEKVVNMIIRGTGVLHMNTASHPYHRLSSFLPSLVEFFHLNIKEFYFFLYFIFFNFYLVHELIHFHLVVV